MMWIEGKGNHGFRDSHNIISGRLFGLFVGHLNNSFTTEGKGKGLGIMGWAWGHHDSHWEYRSRIHKHSI